MDADRKVALERIAADARRELWAIEESERRDRTAALVGKCYRFRNSYSCPQTEADYWWLYAKITGVGSGGTPLAFTFQKDSQGDIQIRFDECVVIDPLPGLGKGWEPISATAFEEMWSTLRAEIERRAYAAI